MPDTATEIFFGDGKYRTWLPLPQVTELERKCGLTDREGRLHPKSIFQLYDQIGDGFVQDGSGNVVFIGGASVSARECNEVIRCALIGGNNGPVDEGSAEVGPQRAARLVELYGYPERPLAEVAALAWKVLHAAIVGIDVKKKEEPSGEGADSSHSERAS